MATSAPVRPPASEPDTFEPYIPASQNIAELTPRALLLGTVLGVIFSASSVYLALKIGLTVSASIPIAVLAVAVFRTIGKSTILENNIVQTAGSAADSIASGVVFTLPAILLMGYDLTWGRVTVLAVAGGIMGILMMIPLRKALIVKEHKTLIYPEGTACAEVLVAGEKGGLRARLLFQAFGLAFLYKFLMVGLRLWKEYPARVFELYKGGSISTEVAPELMGVGFIIGPRIAGLLFSGGVLAYLVLIPAIKLFGGGLTQPLFPASILISDMSPSQVRANYIFYIGAGAVASAGILALARSMPTILAAFRSGFHDLKSSMGEKTVKLRTDLDLPIWVTVAGALGLALVLAFLPQVGVNLLGALLIVVFGFFFVTVSSRITGEIGSSANPISGMTIAALIGTTLIFLLIGWTGVDHRVGAISIAAVIAVAVANGGNTSQDLKTGYLVGATPTEPADRHHDRGRGLGDGHRLDPPAAQLHLHQHRPRVAPRRGAAALEPRLGRPHRDHAGRDDGARRQDLGGGAGQRGDRGRDPRQVPGRPHDARGRLPRRPRHRGPGARDQRPAGDQARQPQGHDHGPGDRRHPDPEAALDPGPARCLHHGGYRTGGAAGAAGGGGGLPADLDQLGDVRGRAGALAGGAQAQERSSARWPKSSRGPASCSPAGSSRAGRSPGSRWPAWRRPWWAGPKRQAFRPPITCPRQRGSTSDWALSPRATWSRPCCSPRWASCCTGLPGSSSRWPTPRPAR